MIEFTENYRKCKKGITVADDQVEAINFMLSRKSAILALGTGMGKTLTALTAVKILMDKFPNSRTVVVCPVKAKKSFESTLFDIMDYNRDEVGIISTNEMDFDMIANKIFLITDTNIEKYSDVVIDLAARGHKIILLVDEAHKLQDPDSKFYKTMSEVKSICTLTYAMTATPILNGIDGLYNIVNFFCPGFLGKKTEFNNKYTIWHLKDQYIKGGRKIKVRVVDGYKNLDELNEKLKKIMIVRQKQYNLKFGNIFEDMSPMEYDIYEKVSSGILGDGEERNFSKRLHDLQRFVDRAYDGDESIKELVTKYNSTQYSTKENMLINTVKKTMDKGFSIIIYADYHDTVERLYKVLKSKKKELGLGNIYEISGTIDIKTREQVEEKIDQRDIVLVTSAGTESINLQKCNCLIFYDIPFSVKTIIQAVGRVCRRDTKHKYQYIITLAMKQTVDEYKYRLFQKNLGLVVGATGIAKDLPLNAEYLRTDEEYIDKLKEEMLWHYRGNTEIRKKHRREKKQIKTDLITGSVYESSGIIAANKFLIEPIQCTDIDVKEVKSLYPDEELYRKYRRGEIPFTKVRADYIKKLRSDDGRKLIKGLQEGVLKHGVLALIGETDEFPEVLKQEVLDQFEI